MTDDSDILIIDRDSASSGLLRSMLSARGFEVRTVARAAQALESVRSNPPALILLSARLADSNGFDFCRQLMQSRKTRRIPFLFLTTRMDLAGQKKALKLGAVDFICKPYQPEEVVTRVKTQMDLRQLRRAAREVSGRAAEARR